VRDPVRIPALTLCAGLKPSCEKVYPLFSATLLTWVLMMLTISRSLASSFSMPSGPPVSE
jgi:hypothetical protein